MLKPKPVLASLAIALALVAASGCGKRPGRPSDAKPIDTKLTTEVSDPTITLDPALANAVSNLKYVSVACDSDDDMIYRFDRLKGLFGMFELNYCISAADCRKLIEITCAAADPASCTAQQYGAGGAKSALPIDALLGAASNGASTHEMLQIAEGRNCHVGPGAFLRVRVVRAGKASNWAQSPVQP